MLQNQSLPCLDLEVKTRVHFYSVSAANCGLAIKVASYVWEHHFRNFRDATIQIQGPWKHEVCEKDFSVILVKDNENRFRGT